MSWFQVNQNGFGQPGTSGGTKLFVFDQDLYAYAINNEYGLFRMQNPVDRLWEELFTPVSTGVGFHAFGDYLYAYEWSAEQLWWIKAGDSFNSGNWKQVTSNGLPSGVSPAPMTVFNGKLYGVYYTSPYTFEIWRSSDIGSTVMNWQRVVQNSFGDPTNNHQVDIMAVFNNHIYAGTMTRDPLGSFGGYWAFGDGVEIWESSSGDSGTWTQINYDGFGTELTVSGVTFRTNQDIGCWAVYKASDQQQEYLYIGTKAHFGAQIWRYDGKGKSGWTDVSPDWAFNPYLGTETYRFNDMTVFQGNLYVAENFPSAMLDKYDGTNWSIEVGDVGSGDPPFSPQNRGLTSLAVTKNKLYVGTWCEPGNIAGDQVWLKLLPGGTPSTPALACDGYETHMVVRGTNNGIYYMRTNYMGGEGWSGVWTKIPGATCDEPALAIMGGNLHLVVRGTDNGIYHKYMDINTGVWSDWISLGGSTVSAPTLITSTSNTLALVVRGSNDEIYYRNYMAFWIYPPGINVWLWTPWTAISGATIDKPALASNGDILTLAVRGKDNGIYVKDMDLSSLVWGGWLPLGETSSAPAVITTFDGEFNMFVRGTNNMIYYTSDTHGGWGANPWWNVPGATIDRPILAKTSIPDEVYHLVVRGADNGIYHSMCHDSYGIVGWSKLAKIPGTTNSCPGVTHYYYVGVELVYRDPSNRIWYDFWSSYYGW